MHQAQKKQLFIETYGCQMNFSDSEIVAAILKPYGYEITDDIRAADVIFVNTCSIRDHAEQRVKKRLQNIASLKKGKPGVLIGLLGCMADRTKNVLMEEESWLDIIAGPDAYRELPKLLEVARQGDQGIHTQLSLEETYADITPVRLQSNGVSAFISIMRGCENFCTYCVVPETRGKERSRDPETIIREARELVDQGFREITLLGQNVNSYHWQTEENVTGFAALMDRVASVDPLLRVRFATSHPKDLSDALLDVMAAHPNICKAIHLPVQSGSSRILKKMNRKYTREQYMERIEAIRKKLPDCSLSTDIIAGFCDETEEDHKETLSLMEWAQYDHAFMFQYSERPGTAAAKRFEDNVPRTVKERRLKEIIELQQKLSLKSNERDTNKLFEVLVEGRSKRSEQEMMGRNSQNKVVVFPANDIRAGEYVTVKVNRCTSATLIGTQIP
jgi:tRNA-2-methylthio-N6-dimethylallyladenosine synthase